MFSLLFVLAVLQLLTVQASENSGVHQYEYSIDSEGHVFEGFVYEDVFKGSYIEVSKFEDEVIKEGARRVSYLRLKITKGNKSMQNVKYDIVGTEAFEINEEGYIIVNDTETLFEDKEIEFYVVLLKVPEEKIVSNPIPFIVRMEISVKPEEPYPAAAAIFAGVLILVIVVMALFIPFVVRIKRRYRSKQKSIKSSVSVQNGTGKGLTKRAESKEPNWFANTEFKYEEEVEKEKEEFTHDILDMSKGASNSVDTIQLSKKSKLDWINPHAGDDSKTGILKNNGSYNQTDSKL